MSAGFQVDGEVFRGPTGAVEEYVIALADLAADRLGPDHPLAEFLADERDDFRAGAVIDLDEWLVTAAERRRFLDLLDTATDRAFRDRSPGESGREWADTVADLRDWIADGGGKRDKPAPGPTRFGTLDALQVVFGVAACSGVFFAVSGPAKNPAHLLFRLGVMGVGLVGLTVVTVVKLSRRGRG